MRLLLALLVGCAISSAQTIATDHTDNLRLSVVTETTLTPSNLATGFGKLATITLPGKPYGQPLYVPGLTIGGQTRNAIFVSDNTNKTYAYDADTYVLLWTATTGETPCTSACSGFNYGLNFGDQVGIFGTAGIDVPNGWIFFVTFSNSRIYKLWKVNLLTGATVGSALTLTATASPSTAGDAVGGVLTFNPTLAQQRVGITIANGNVYVGFGSLRDASPWHGWIMARRESDLAVIANFCANPNTIGGGFWMSGSGFGVLPNGNLIAVTGNGEPNSTSYDGITEFSMSILQLSPTLSVVDWFTPTDYATQNANDTDLGSSHPMVIANPASPGNFLIVTGGKDYKVYAVHSECMGHLGGTVGGCSPQIFNTGTDAGEHLGIYGDAHMNGVSYFPNTNGALYAFTLAGTGLYNTTPVTGSVTAFPGAMLTGSINGTSNAVLWAITANTTTLIAPSAGKLTALNASTLANIWSSGDLAGDALGAVAKFISPTVAHGKVYVPTYDGSIIVYGLLPHLKVTGGVSFSGGVTVK